MSNYSFSHQFYQRWTQAPEPIRAAITQELTDISTLLHTDTQFEEFVFSAPDLDAHLDDLYENHNAELAIAKAIADKQAKYRADAEEQRLKEKEQKKQADEKAKLKEQETKLRQEVQEAEAAEKEQQGQEINKQLEADKNHLADKEAVIDTDKASVDNADEKQNNTSTPSINQQTNIAHDSNIKTVIDKAVSGAAISLSLKDTKLGTNHEDLIRELEMHVDDYLSEQMAQMSENLKSWLRAEVTQHLTEQGQSSNSDSLDKQKD